MIILYVSDESRVGALQVTQNACFFEQIKDICGQPRLGECAEQKMKIPCARCQATRWFKSIGQFRNSFQRVVHSKAERAAFSQADLFHDQDSIAGRTGCV